MRARTPKEDPQAVADRNKARRQAELEQAATLQDDAAILTDEMRKIYGFRNLGRRGATAAQVQAATPKPTPAAPAYNANSDSNRTSPQTTGALAKFDNKGSPLAPVTSPRPMPNPNYGSPLAPVTSPRPQPNPIYQGTSARAAPLAPVTSIRPQPNPFFSSSDQKQGQHGYSLAPATSPRPQPNPNYSKPSKKNK